MPDLMARMNEAQKHRGPNDRGIFEEADQGAAFGHVRLSILDLSDRASQPMYSPDGRYVLVYNGEIYNFIALREDLIKKGHIFSSRGDTEVLLHGLIQYGETFLERLNGMFALALWDRHEHTLLVARDHLGIKPFYYTELENGTFLFASELKALCAHPSVRREPDFEVILQHLAYGHATSNRTALKGIDRLPPGSLLRWNASTRTRAIRKYWRPSFDASVNGDREQAVHQLRELLRAATVRQMVSDVPVGVLLSGGLDSSLITAFARPQANSDFRCFTISYPPDENRLDGGDLDAPHARRFARELGLPLEEIEIKPQVAALLSELIYYLDEPIVDPAAIASFLISRLARERGTTVLLSGQGSDEMFCGYPRYVAMQASAWFKRVPLVLRRAIAAAANMLPGSREGSLGVSLRRIRRLASSLYKGQDERFLAYCAATTEDEISRVLSAELRADLGGKRFHDACLEHMCESGLSNLARVQERDLTIYLPNHNLLYTDRMSMAVGMETRVPFLDLELLNTVLSYQPRWKLAGRTTKVLLREAARGVVPSEIIERRKGGFGAPYRKWLRYDLAEMWDDLTSEAAVKRRGWFDAKALQDARRRSQEGAVDLYLLQWAVLTIELWARRFIDDNPIECGDSSSLNCCSLMHTPAIN